MSEQPGTGMVEPRPEVNPLALLLLRAQCERVDPGGPVLHAAGTTTPPPNSAFVEFVEQTQHRLAQQVLALVHGDVHRAEDVVQETYLRIWKGLAKFDPARLATGDPLAWLKKVAHNIYVSQGRRRRPQLGGSFTEDDGQPPLAREPASPDAGPAEQAEINERDGALHDALAGLPQDKQTLLWNHYRDELSHQEIADRHGLTRGQVNMMLYSARRELEPRLEKFVVDDPD